MVFDNAEAEHVGAPLLWLSNPPDLVHDCERCGVLLIRSICCFYCLREFCFPCASKVFGGFHSQERANDSIYVEDSSHLPPACCIIK